MTKSCISSTHEFIWFTCSTNCEIAPRIGSHASAFVVALECRIIVARCTSTVLCLLRVMADLCSMLEDMSDCYSS